MNIIQCTFYRLLCFVLFSIGNVPSLASINEKKKENCDSVSFWFQLALYKSNLLYEWDRFENFPLQSISTINKSEWRCQTALAATAAFFDNAWFWNQSSNIQSLWNCTFFVVHNKIPLQTWINSICSAAAAVAASFLLVPLSISLTLTFCFFRSTSN